MHHEMKLGDKSFPEIPSPRGGMGEREKEPDIWIENIILFLEINLG